MVVRSRRRCFYYLVLVAFFTFLSLYGYQLYLENERFFNPVVGGFNYFAEAQQHSKLGYVVNTTNCRILNISALDESLISVTSSYLKRPVDCSANKKKWTYIEDQNLVINTTNLAEYGVQLDDISCCYVTVTRVKQSPTNYDMDADRKIRYSKNCTPFRDQVTQIDTAEFIRVRCTGKYFPFNSDVLYRQFHAIAIPSRNNLIISKLEYWEAYQGHSKSNNSESSQNQVGPERNEVPPNVVIIGIDSLSRLGFRRNMAKTKKALENLGAIEMFGYTKVGENTFPNSVSFLSGYSENELEKICYKNRQQKQDNCPYIWKRFAESHYLTAIVEDAPFVGGFNYLKTGFVDQPVDYYFRPFMLSLYEAGLTVTHILDCIGYKTVDETLLQYITDLIGMSMKKSTPLFVYSWLTNLAHNDVNSARFGDETYANFLKNTNLNNTILFFMSDHGYRYGKVRETFAGWYEDKLPNFWLYLPPSLKLKYRNWNNALMTNSDRLSSPYDLYKTMEHVLETFTSVSGIPNSKTQSGTELPRRFGQSFFSEIPFDRACNDAGVAKSFCACVVPRMLDVNDTNLMVAATAAVTHINLQLPSMCSKLSIQRVSGGAVLEQNESLNPNDKEEKQYIVDFYADPGSFLFEATVTRLQNDSFSVDNELLRMNQINTDVSCLSDSVMERFCFCSTKSS